MTVGRDEDESIFIQHEGEKEPRKVRIIDLFDPRMPRADSLIRHERMAICRECDMFGTADLCGVCHCFMPAKSWLLDAVCPLGKW